MVLIEWMEMMMLMIGNFHLTLEMMMRMVIVWVGRSEMMRMVERGWGW